MITAGNYISAVNTLMNLWKKVHNLQHYVMKYWIRKLFGFVEGFPLWKPRMPSISTWMHWCCVRISSSGRPLGTPGLRGWRHAVSAGRLGLDSWPRTEVRDATLAQNRVLFLTGMAVYGNISSPRFSDKRTLSSNTPQTLGILQDYQPDTRWAAIEADVDSNTLYALSENGILLELNLEDKAWYSKRPAVFGAPCLTLSHRRTSAAIRLPVCPGADRSPSMRAGVTAAGWFPIPISAGTSSVMSPSPALPTFWCWTNTG